MVKALARRSVKSIAVISVDLSFLFTLWHGRNLEQIIA
jgi:hypothetical protein